MPSHSFSLPLRPCSALLTPSCSLAAPAPCRQSSLDGSSSAAAAAEAANVAADLEGQEKAKRKGRFRYVEDDYGDSKARLGNK